MTVIEIAIALLLSIYPLSYAKCNWKKNQRFQAAGMVFAVLVMLALASYVILF
jgi:hypothetical protein